MAIIINNIPLELKQKPQWIGYKLLPQEGKKAIKKPINLVTGTHDWGDTTLQLPFIKALKKHKEFNCDGLGFILKPPYVGIDIDGSVDLTIASEFKSYTEYSPSRNGYHIIVKGSIPKALKLSNLEIYQEGRWFTMTGNKIVGFPGTIANTNGNLSKYFAQDRDLTQELLSIKPSHSTQGRTPTFVRIIGKLKKKGLTKEEIGGILKPWSEKYEYTKFDYLLEDQFKRYPNAAPTFQSRYYEETEEKSIEVYSPATHLAKYKRKFSGDEPKPETIFTGFPSIDSFTDGYTKGGLWVIGARPRIGKTSYCVTAALKLLEQGRRVVFFTTETNWKSVFNRFISLGTGIDFRKIKSGTLTPEDQIIFEKYLRTFESYPLFIIDKAQPKSREVAQKISELRPDIFFFDHIHRVATESEQRRLDIGRFIVDLNNIARTNNIPGVVGAQLNRAADFEKPALYHLKECGQLEEEAHAVVLISNVTIDGTMKRLDFAKNREGESRVIEMKYIAGRMEFQEI